MLHLIRTTCYFPLQHAPYKGYIHYNVCDCTFFVFLLVEQNVIKYIFCTFFVHFLYIFCTFFVHFLYIFCTCQFQRNVCVHVCALRVDRDFFSGVRWLPSYVCVVNARKKKSCVLICYTCMYTCTLYMTVHTNFANPAPRRSGYFGVKRMCAVKRGLTVYNFYTTILLGSCLKPNLKVTLSQR